MELPAEYRSSETISTALMSIANNVPADTFSVGSNLAQLLDEFSLTSDALSSTVESSSTLELTPWRQHQCTSPSCSALKVFGTPELLALVLTFLDTSDILISRRVNKTWARAVTDTPQLRMCLFLRPQWLRPPANYMLLDYGIPGLSIQKGDPVDKGQWIEITMNARAAREIVPWACSRRTRRDSMALALSRMRSMSVTSNVYSSGAPEGVRTAQALKVKYDELHIMQPPLLGIQAYMIDPDGSDASSMGSSTGSDSDNDDNDPDASQTPAPCAKISCDAGINLEFVAEATLALLPERGGDPDDDDRQIVFKAIVSFCEPAQSLRKRGTTRSVILLE